VEISPKTEFEKTPMAAEFYCRLGLLLNLLPKIKLELWQQNLNCHLRSCEAKARPVRGVLYGKRRVMVKGGHMYVGMPKTIMFTHFVFDRANTCLQHMSKWLIANRLSLNVDKTCFCVFRLCEQNLSEIMQLSFQIM